MSNKMIWHPASELPPIRTRGKTKNKKPAGVTSTDEPAKG